MNAEIGALGKERSRLDSAARRSLLGKCLLRGLLGGLAATLVMDLLLMAIFVLAGIPPLTCFALIGDTLAGLFSSLHLPGGVPLGILAHYLIGPLLGAAWALVTVFVPALRAATGRKAVLYAVLYAEIVSQPLLMLPPLLLEMPASQVLLWFGGAFGMHLIWGCVYGLFWHLALRAAILPPREPSR